MNDKIIKLLNLTTSDNDNEALSAIRTCNAMLKKANLRWEKLIGVVVKSETPPKQEPPKRPRYESSGAVDDELGPPCENQRAWLIIFRWLGDVYLSPKQEELVTSIGHYFANRGYMSDKQRACVYRIYKERGGSEW